MTSKIAAALTCSVMLAVSGCGGQSSARRLAFITNNAADFWTIARKGTEKAAAELPDFTIEFRLGDGTAAAQKRIVDDLLAKGVDGLAISPVDPANQTAMLNEAAAEGHRLHARQRCARQPARVLRRHRQRRRRPAGRGSDQGSTAAGGRIALFVGKLDARNAQERLQGIKEAIAGTKIEIIDVRTDDTDQVRAKANVAEMLVSHPDVAALVGLWSYNGPAILNAVRDAGKIGRVKIIAFDEDDETLAGVKAGAIVGTVVQQPYEFGYQAITLLAKAAKGDRSGIPASRQIFIPTMVIRQNNVDEFKAKLVQLRGR